MVEKQFFLGFIEIKKNEGALNIPSYLVQALITL